MRLATYRLTGPLGLIERLGLIVEPRDVPGTLWVADLNLLVTKLRADSPDTASIPHPERWADFLIPPCMRSFLELGAPSMNAARGVADFLQSRTHKDFEALRGLQGQTVLFPLDSVILHTPMPRPRMFRDFLAFETHVANGWKRRNEPIPEAWYKAPIYYKGNPNTLIGTDTPVVWPRYSRLMDYELELACIIGKEGRDISVENADDYIAGYAIMNDFSARDTQKNEMMCRLGPAKGKDFATAVGPWLVTKDAVPGPQNLRMQARINGETWSDGNSGTAHWTFAQMIAHISQDETIYPGDILGSGTVGFGCGLELDRWLQPNDVVELEIEGLGILRNQILVSA